MGSFCREYFCRECFCRKLMDFAIAGIANQLHHPTNLVTNLVTNPVIPAKQVVDLRGLESRA